MAEPEPTGEQDPRSRLEPLYLLDGGVEPLVPASLALLGGLADEQRRDARPLVLAYFMTAALRISSSVFFHTPPFIMILILAPSFPQPPPPVFSSVEGRVVVYGFRRGRRPADPGRSGEANRPPPGF